MEDHNHAGILTNITKNTTVSTDKPIIGHPWVSLLLTFFIPPRTTIRPNVYSSCDSLGIPEELPNPYL